MFGFSLATQIFQGSTQRTWNCVSHFANLIWGKFSHYRQGAMPRSRKRHHSRSRSRSRSRSTTRDRSHDRHKKIDSHEKDGKRRKVDEVDSPQHKRSLSSGSDTSTNNEVQRIQELESDGNLEDNPNSENKTKIIHDVEEDSNADSKPNSECNGDLKSEDENRKPVADTEDINSKDPVSNEEKNKPDISSSSEVKMDESVEMAEVPEKAFNGSAIKEDDEPSIVEDEANESVDKKENKKTDTSSESDAIMNASDESKKIDERIGEKESSESKSVSDSDDADVVIVSDSESSRMETKNVRKGILTTPKKCLTPKQLQKKLESEKKKQQRQKEREDREKQKQEEKAKLIADKQKAKQQKEEERLKLIEQKQKEKEMKEEQKRKEKEEREQKRKEKEEQELQKKKEKEMEKLKKQQEIEEKIKEKQKEEELKQKTAAFFVGFFKKSDKDKEKDKEEKEKDTKISSFNSNFKPFEVKSDMRLPPRRRNPLSAVEINSMDSVISSQNKDVSYLKELKAGKLKLGKCLRTWPFEEPEDEVTIVEDDKDLGETICEEKPTVHRIKAKFLHFCENKRPAYFGTWRKKSKAIKPRRPFGEDTDILNYEEDSDDDWEDEEQGESLDVSDEEEKEPEDDYEVDNEFFVPHGHLSEDEMDDEENSKLSPESLKQKLKLLKDEFDQEIKSKTHKLKPRSIGCIWYNKQGDNVEEAIRRYLQPFAMIYRGQISIKKRSEIFVSSPDKKIKPLQELPPEHIPIFLKIIHGNLNKKQVLIEQFLTYMTNNGLNVEVSKAQLTRFLKQTATYKRCTENGPMKNKFGWFVNDNINEKYNVNLDLSSKKANANC